MTDTRLLLVRAGLLSSSLGRLHAFDYADVTDLLITSGGITPQLRVNATRPFLPGHELNIQNDAVHRPKVDAFVRAARGHVASRGAPLMPLPDPSTRSKLPGKLGEAVNAALQPDEDVLDELTSTGEGLVVTSRRVLIVKGGFASQAMFGQKVKSYPFEAITLVTGEAFEDAASALVLAPLGLRDTFLRATDVPPARAARGHTRRDGQVHDAHRAVPRGCVSAAGAVGSARDALRLARFALGDGRAGSGERVLPEDTLRAALDARLTFGRGGGVGLGWLTEAHGGAVYVGHAGTWLGQFPAVWASRAHGAALAVLTNGDGGRAVHEGIVRAWREEVLDVPHEAPPEVVPADATELREVAGRYVRPSGVAHVFEIEGDALRLRYEGRDGEPLGRAGGVRVARTRGAAYVVQEGAQTGAAVEFVRDDAGRVAWTRTGVLVPREREGPT